jgi:hypothetical protein
MEFTRRLAAPLDLLAMPSEVAAAARPLLQRERCSASLHDAALAERVLRAVSDLDDRSDFTDVRVPVVTGLARAAGAES